MFTILLFHYTGQCCYYQPGVAIHHDYQPIIYDLYIWWIAENMNLKSFKSSWWWEQLQHTFVLSSVLSWAQDGIGLTVFYIL